MRLLSFLCFFALSISAAEQAFRQVLIDTKAGVHQGRFHRSGAEVGTKSKWNWQFHKWPLEGGRQDGADALEMNNGRIRLLVVPTRGLSIMWARSPGTRLQWFSPVMEAVHPKHMDLGKNGGRGWTDGFNEWLVRTGLEFAGEPGKDQVTVAGEAKEVALTLNGRVANTTPTYLEIILEESGRMRMLGKLEEKTFTGGVLELSTELVMELGQFEFKITDEVKNLGAEEQEFQLIYQANYGFPLLDGGTKLEAPISRVFPFNAEAAPAIKVYQEHSKPRIGAVEQIYCMLPLGGKDGMTTAMLVGPKGTNGVAMNYSIEQLPFLTLRKNTRGIDEGFYTALAPGTSLPNARPVERAAGRVPKLKPGESRKFAITYQLLDGEEEVQKTRALIEQLQGEKRPVLDTEPLPAGKPIKAE